MENKTQNVENKEKNVEKKRMGRLAGLVVAAYIAVKSIGILIKFTFKKQNK